MFFRHATAFQNFCCELFKLINADVCYIFFHYFSSNIFKLLLYKINLSDSSAKLNTKRLTLKFQIHKRQRFRGDSLENNNNNDGNYQRLQNPMPFCKPGCKIIIPFQWNKL